LKTLVIYDNTGRIFFNASGDVQEPVGIPFFYVDVPEGKRVIGVDVTVTPNVAILEDIPKTETQQLKEQVDSLTLALAEMIGA
jgi:hypothetical protein